MKSQDDLISFARNPWGFHNRTMRSLFRFRGEVPTGPIFAISGRTVPSSLCNMSPPEPKIRISQISLFFFMRKACRFLKYSGTMALPVAFF